MNRRVGFFVGAGLTLLLGLLGSYLLSQATPYQEVVKHGPAPEALGNAYLAAEHFLRSQGRTVQRADNLQSLAQLPAAGQMLLVLGSREQMTPKQTERLLAWTRKGGHLLVVAETLWDKEKNSSGDLLLDPLGIQQYMSDELDEGDNDGDSKPETADAAAEDSETPPEPAAPANQEPAAAAEHAKQSDKQASAVDLTQLYLENEDAPAYINFDTDFHLFDSKDLAHAWANSADSTHMLQLSQGDGLLTVVTDSWLWQNSHIGEYDNAWLLWYLTQDREVTLLYRADRDDLFSLLFKHFPEALLALSLLLAASLWAAGRRQGPLRAVPLPQRRQLQEHLRSSADFILRHAGQRHLLQALQRDIQRRARLRHAGFDRLGVAEQWQVLSRMTRLSTSAISQAMRPIAEKRLSASEFTRQVAHLQTLRNVL